MSQISPASYLASLSPQEQEEWLNSLSHEAKASLKWDWNFWARPNQLEPEGDWNTWLILAGRGFGKTRIGSETIRSWACGETPLSGGRYGRIALVAETAADARDVMVEGESGILACHPKDFRPEYQKTNRKLTWPNGAVAYLYNATEPDQLRGPQHDAGWADELAKFQYMQETWDQLQFGMRLGAHPKVIVTTTPRPLPLIKKLVIDPDTYVTRGSTFDNAGNLARPFLKQIEERYGGTRLGRQELEGEILGDIPGALWTRGNIDDNRLREVPEDLERVIVAVDPAASSEEGADENGIVVVGLARDADGYARGYVLEDGSLRGTPEEWANKAVNLYRKWQADKVVAEKNNGGEMVESVLKTVDRSLPVKLVHATRGKIVRAEPISALYEQGRVHHVGRFDELEDQMCLFSVDNIRNASTGSPDRVDALVWGLSEIFDRIAGRRRVRKNKDEIIIDKTSSDWNTDTQHTNSPNGWMTG